MIVFIKIALTDRKICLYWTVSAQTLFASLKQSETFVSCLVEDTNTLCFQFKNSIKP